MDEFPEWPEKERQNQEFITRSRQNEQGMARYAQQQLQRQLAREQLHQATPGTHQAHPVAQSPQAITQAITPTVPLVSNRPMSNRSTSEPVIAHAPISRSIEQPVQQPVMQPT
jgi:hypothetical protein